jgi:hypothetical protein
MADDLKQTGKPDDQRINIVSREELRNAVKHAGPVVRDVRQHLSR